MKIAFLTEMGFIGKVPADHKNMRTEFAWMNALDADHIPLFQYNRVAEYDFIFIIWPKADVLLNAEGVKMSDIKKKLFSQLINTDIIGDLKQRNSKVFFVQEGPTWFSNDYNIAEQIYHHNLLNESDAIFCHNEWDAKWYKGLAANTPVYVIPTLMCDELVKGIQPIKSDRVVIGGNFARWYGGFQSYQLASLFTEDVWVPSMHNKQPGEENLLNHFPYMVWDEWMKSLSSFKLGIHLMPTVAAGTFSLNCAYFGIPSIGNIKVDTQRICHPDLSVDVEDMESALKIALKLRDDREFYDHCCVTAKTNYETYYTKDVYVNKIKTILNEIRNRL